MNHFISFYDLCYFKIAFSSYPLSTDLMCGRKRANYVGRWSRHGAK
jgi:hypothetical protein